MRSILPVALFALAGLLTGGAWSVRGQGGSKAGVVLMGALALLAAVGGALWLVSD